ncbi:hypothetical protein ISN44_As09g018440 [Arabidopsis suecica]|uniref:DUF629 domain-containing protein n=1 Tax=Arabidopsis suecica TaxID=45249 RepID=A0A8T2ALK3_ARASU|nr:hypothetical protein ISN44_As09g018440 [Arabidopsis suecica]
MMTKSSGQSDDENTKSKISDAAKVAARDFWVERNRFRALELIEKTISDHGNHEKCFSHHELQGDIFYYQAINTDDTDLKCVYLFASVDAYSMATLLYPYAMSSFPGYARSMIKLGDQLRIKKYYCKMHILDNHVHTSEPKFSARPKYVDEILADMICCGDWKPVDTEKAANLIKDRTKSRKELVYVNGWCSDWPVTNDKDRENILKQFSEVLKSSCAKENRTLSCALWDWLVDYTEENLDLPGVPGIYLDKCSFFKNPQCICFLDLKHLKHILKYFRQLTTDVRASLVSKVVNQFWENSQVKERIDLEGLTTYNLLLDKRLLYEEEIESDNIGTVEHYKSTGIYEDVMPKGDKIVSWIFDCPEIGQDFVSQMAKGVHNHELWLAALRIVRCVVRKMERYYDKRHRMVTYEKMLNEAKTICDREDSRKNENQRSTYESVLRMKCEELVGKQDDDTKCFLTVVRDVFQRKSSPSFEVLEDKEECISKRSTTVPNDDVKKSLSTLKKSLKEKFPLIDSKILRNKSTYKKLIDVFPKLSAVEYRLVVLPFVKKFLQDKLKKMMKTNSSSVAAGDSAERERKKRHLSNEGLNFGGMILADEEKL